jgi:hypothetical protein
MNRRYSGLSLARQANAHTVLLRMAEDEDRAARIAELKKRHPRLTWAKIAEETGVKERSAIKWQKTGALKPENAEALARLFGVDFDYVWTGPRPDTPGMFVDRRNTPAGPVAVDRLDGELEERITRIEGTLQEILMLLGEARTEQDRISGLLVDTVTRPLMRRAKHGRIASVRRRNGSLKKPNAMLKVGKQRAIDVPRSGPLRAERSSLTQAGEPDLEATSSRSSLS